jgi:hypothetical protein
VSGLAKALASFTVERIAKDAGFALCTPGARHARLHAPREDGRGLCGVKARQHTIEMHAAWWCRRCQRVALRIVEGGKAR